MLSSSVRISLCLLLGVSLWACGEEAQAPNMTPENNNKFTLTCPESANPRPSYLNELVCPTAFSSLASRPNTALFANTSLVKFVIDLQDDNTTYFFNSREYSLHYHFCRDNLEREGLDPVGSHGEFNARQYRSPDRRFILGTLAFYQDQNVIAMEFATGDSIQEDQIRFAYNHLKSKVYFSDDLLLRPISGDHEAIARAGLEDDIPVIYTSDLFAGITYQPLNPAISYGYLRVMGEEDPSTARPTDIVVLKEAPNDIPPVAGIITQTFQTPLSHVNVLSQNRGTPNMGLKDALRDETILSFKDQIVRLEVTPQSWNLEAATLDQAESYWDSNRPEETFVPPLDLSVEGLPDLADLDASAVDKIGAKAANLAEMMNISPPLPLPREPFAIPFRYYRQHMEDNGLQSQVDAILADPRYREDAVWRAEALTDLRVAIATAPMDIELRAMLHDKVFTRFGLEKVRFRSSTNSEDLPGFNGAGLYTSGSGRVGSENKDIADVVRVVWASLWNDRAVGERDYYRIDHSQVAMAVLVHPAFPNEAANGVAFTTNPFNARRPAHYVNVQQGEASVANPGPGDLSDQFLLYTWYEEPEVEYLSRSNLIEDGSVLRWEEVLALSTVLEQIHDHFIEVYKPETRRGWGMDVEFKFLGRERTLLVKQARPIPQ